MKVTVIIPTHNRCKSLQRTLRALLDDPHLAESGEVVVVADGCSDGTLQVLRERRWRWPLRVLDQTPGRGAAAARNAGAAIARGSLLLFLDDDVEPSPGLVERHLRAHSAEPRRAAVGTYPPALRGAADPVHVLKRNWWLGKFHEIGKSGHRFDYRDLLSGNLSLSSSLFEELRGFDSGIGSAGGEDYEFGIRLFEAGAELVFLPDAHALHHEHETTDLDRFMARARQEGRADVRMAERHRAICSALPLVQHYRRKRRRSLPRSAAWATGDLGTLFPLLVTPLLRSAGWLGAHRSWLRLCGSLHEYWYWRGVREAVGDRESLEDLFVGSAPPAGHEIELDLAEGIERAERELDRVRPDALNLRYGRFSIGRVPPAPAAEPLRGCHLRKLLVEDLAWPLLKAKSAHEALDTTAEEELSVTEYGLVSRGDEPLGWIGTDPPKDPESLRRRVTERLDYPLLLQTGPTWLGEPPHRTGSCDFTVVVLVHRGGVPLEHCCDALRAQRLAPVEILLVGVTPGVPPPELEDVCWLGHANGAAAARNRGWRAASSSLVAFTNETARPSPGWLEHLGAAFDQHVAATGGLVTAAHIQTAEQAWYDQCRDGTARGVGRFHVQGGAGALSPQLWGCYLDRRNLAVQRRVLAELGGFDETLDRFGDESVRDLVFRLLRSGRSLTYVPSARVAYVPPAGPATLNRHRHEAGRGFAAYLWKRRHDVPPSYLLRFALRQWWGRHLLPRLRYPDGIPRRLVLLELGGAIWPWRGTPKHAVAGPGRASRRIG